MLQAAVLREGFLAALIPAADQNYSAPKSDWLTRECFNWVTVILTRLKVLPYRPEAWDCDDFADTFKVFASVCHRRMGVNTGLAVGVIHYTSEKQGPHAINMALTSDLGLVFFEPQTGKLVTLTPEEKKSIWHARF
jgi:hypothetical protein